MPVKLKPTQLVKWDKKDEPLIRRYLKELLDILEIKEDGRVETTKGFSLMLFRKILVQNLELFGIDAVDVRQGLVYKTVFRLKKLKKQDIHGFRRSLAAEVKHYLDRPIEKYTILLPFHASSNNPPPIKKIQILGVELLFRNWGYVRKNFEFPRFLQALCAYNDETLEPNNLVCRAQEKRHVSGTEWQVGRRRNEDRSSSQSQTSPTCGGIQVAYSA